MKKQPLIAFISLSLIVLFAGASASAQSGVALRATIPFDFSIRNRHLPAGEYVITQISQGCLQISSKDGGVSQVFMISYREARKGPDQSSLVFNRYGDQYFLSKIWTSGYKTGRELAPSRAERQLIRGIPLARMDTAVETVSVTAHQQ